MEKESTAVWMRGVVLRISITFREPSAFPTRRRTAAAPAAEDPPCGESLRRAPDFQKCVTAVIYGSPLHVGLALFLPHALYGTLQQLTLSVTHISHGSSVASTRCPAGARARQRAPRRRLSAMPLRPSQTARRACEPRRGPPAFGPKSPREACRRRSRCPCRSRCSCRSNCFCRCG